MLTNNQSVYVDKSPKIGGLGVFAGKDLEKGESIETCPLIMIPVSQEKLISQTVLDKYYFEYDKNYIVVVSGYGSLYNHSYHANAEYDFDYKKKVMILKAAKKINKGEEIFINYNGEVDDETPITWFDENLEVK